VKVYIAGPMTSLPEFNFPAFNAAAAAWRAAGWDVLNPAESFDGRTDLAYRDYVLHDIDLLLQCDAIAMLPGWDGANARGSVWEWGLAQKILGIAVYDATKVVAAENVAPKKPADETILQEAQRLVHGNRGADYGHPIDDYTRTGRMWGAILGLPDIDPRICCLMMAAMKISRETNKHKRDNLTDLAGYAECAQMVAERQESA
jgi:nucleoside 2-deoxyribosyltransferase